MTIGAHQAPEYGIRPGTVRCWASRGRLHARGLDRFNRPLYALADVLALAPPTRQPADLPSDRPLCNA